MKGLILRVLPILLAADLAVAEQGRTLYSFEEVSAFFLANNPDQTKEYFDEMLAKESFEKLVSQDCFGTFWEYELASSLGHSSSFSHIVCRDRAVSRDAYKRWYQSHKQSGSGVTASYKKTFEDEVAEFFLSKHPSTYTRQHFDWYAKKDKCFLPLWESALARSKGQSTTFDHDYCKTLAEPRVARDPSLPSSGRKTRKGPDHPPSVQFFISESGRTFEDYQKLPKWAKDQWRVWHSEGSTASSPVYTRQTYNESKSKEKSGSFFEQLLWGYIEHEIDCKIGECAERERLLRDVEAAAARGAARGSRANSRRYYDSKGRPVPQNNSPQPLRTGPYCSGPYAGDCD